MKKPNDWDQVQKYSSVEPLPPGGYICRVIKVDEYTSENGTAMLRVGLDIDSGEWKDHFLRRFQNDTRMEKKWPCVRMVYLKEYQSDATSRDLKTFVEDLRSSNQGWEPAWGDKFCAHCSGKKIGVVFGREQFESRDGKLIWTTKPKNFKTVEEINSGDFKIPEDKPVNGVNTDNNLTSNNGFRRPQPDNQNQQMGIDDIPAGFEELDEDLPF